MSQFLDAINKSQVISNMLDIISPDSTADILQKGMERPNHKYFKREPDGKGGWKYYYTEEQYKKEKGLEEENINIKFNKEIRSLAKQNNLSIDRIHNNVLLAIEKNQDLRNSSILMKQGYGPGMRLALYNYYNQESIKEKEESKSTDIIDPKKKYDFKINGYVDSYQHMEPISFNGTIADVRKKAKEKFDEFKTKQPKENYWMTISIKDEDSKYGFRELFDERVVK